MAKAIVEQCQKVFLRYHTFNVEQEQFDKVDPLFLSAKVFLNLFKSLHLLFADALQ